MHTIMVRVLNHVTKTDSGTDQEDHNKAVIQLNVYFI